MQTVIIPRNQRNTWECIVNGVVYSYPSGTTQSVPDEVASLIRNYYASLPNEKPPETLEETVTRLVSDYVGSRMRVVIKNADVSDEEAKDITERFKYEYFEALTKDSFAEIELQFTYDSMKYITRSFYRATPTGGGRNTVVFLAHHETDGVTDGVVLYKVYTADHKVYGIVEKVLFDAE